MDTLTKTFITHSSLVLAHYTDCLLVLLSAFCRDRVSPLLVHNGPFSFQPIKRLYLAAHLLCLAYACTALSLTATLCVSTLPSTQHKAAAPCTALHKSVIKWSLKREKRGHTAIFLIVDLESAQRDIN